MSTALAALRLVAVGSTNPVKIGAVRAVLTRIAPHVSVEGVAVESGVSDQPWGDEETIKGAVARARAARLALDADWGVGIEGGVIDEDGTIVRTCAWAAIVGRDGRPGVGGSLSLEPDGGEHSCAPAWSWATRWMPSRASTTSSAASARWECSLRDW